VGRILITGSSSGIGQAAAVALVARGHEVVLHARNEQRAAEALAAVPGASGVVVGDLASFEETRRLAEQARRSGPYETMVLNAGIARFGAVERELTVDGHESMFQVNTLSAYLLVALLPRPRRLIFTSSALAGQGVLDLADPDCRDRPFGGLDAYAATKLHLVLLALGLGRRRPEVDSLAFDPGWVATAMTARNNDRAPLTAEHAGERLAALVTGSVVPPDSYDTERSWRPGPAEKDPQAQDGLLELCARLTGVTLQ
jgi:NAD(P)-dependent dehydrogenase (short-subunit alcohol dehydrogenase family)